MTMILINFPHAKAPLNRSSNRCRDAFKHKLPVNRTFENFRLQTFLTVMLMTKKRRFDRVLLSWRYSPAGTWFNTAVRASAPWLWQTLRDYALTGHQPRRADFRPRLSSKWRLAHARRLNPLAGHDRHKWQKAFQLALRF